MRLPSACPAELAIEKMFEASAHKDEVKLEVYKRFMTKKPFGLVPWVDDAIQAGVERIAVVFSSKEPSYTPDKCFVPLDHSQTRSVLALITEGITREVHSFLLRGECLRCQCE